MIDPAHRKSLTAALLALAACFPAADAETITGRVVGVHDGDTITVLDAGNVQHKIRLGQIDAPELRQDFGQVSKDALSNLVFDKAVDVEVETVDRYKRKVGKVLVGGVDANLSQVRAGMAWAYRQYARDPAYFTAEDGARAARLGLWSRPDATPPWEYRHGKKGGGEDGEGGVAAAVMKRLFSSPGAAGGGACGEKRFCKQMANCAEATHYLKDCGVSGLDRDGDGVPCEALCKR